MVTESDGYHLVHRILESSGCRKGTEWDTARHEVDLSTRERSVSHWAQDTALALNSWSFGRLLLSVVVHGLFVFFVNSRSFVPVVFLFFIFLFSPPYGHRM